jgi:serine/threonine protein phosphatase PrpC
VLLVVADGLGGYPLGEVAAQMAVDCMVACFKRHAVPRIADGQAFLTHAFLTAHYEILRYAVVRSMAVPPRTTLVAALVQDGQVQWAHCGDSRLYWVRGDAVLARTVDHAGPDRRINTPADLSQRHVLYTCVGAPTLPRIDVSEVAPLEPGDKLLLCSDGLWGQLSDMEITRGIAHLPPHAATETLVQRAYRQAGSRSDNLTALAFE